MGVLNKKFKQKKNAQSMGVLHEMFLPKSPNFLFA
jgi:hypothetical protein